MREAKDPSGINSRSRILRVDNDGEKAEKFLSTPHLLSIQSSDVNIRPRPRTQRVFSAEQLSNWLRPAGETQLRRHPRHGGRDTVHPQHR